MQGTLVSGMEKPLSGMPGPSSPQEGSRSDPYRGVVFFLLAAAVLGTAGAIAAGLLLPNRELLDVAVTLGISSGVLVGVAMAQAARRKPPKGDKKTTILTLAEVAETPPSTTASADGEDSILKAELRNLSTRLSEWFRTLGASGVARVLTAVAGIVASAVVLWVMLPATGPATLPFAIAAGVCLVGTGLALMAAHYLKDIETARFPEAAGLCRGARVVAWVLVLAALSMGLAWEGQQTIVRVLDFVVLAVNLAVCYGLFAAKQPEGEAVKAFPLDLGALSVLGSRTNVLGSILDTAEQQLGIDLRSTWALTVVRQSLEPLIMSLVLLSWLSTSFTVVGLQEQGLVERLGVPVQGQPLQPGLHLHWPWPIDQVFRIPVLRIQALQVGHEGEEGGGPENVLWAVEHAPNEYTLLLGNGRDLITIDAAVQYLISDPRAWRYNSQNPADALRAIAYRAVMRSTVNRTLTEALSENVVVLTGQMRAMVQHDADAMGLGVNVVNFTIGGMHPPVMVAGAYEGVVSAELGKVTAVVDAQVYRNQTVPAAESSVLVDENNARAEGAEALATAAGEAWSFRTLETQYRSSPEEYLFRRRVETLENGLASRHYTIVDSRFQRDGGELWLTP